jgi:lysophospholipase L1-like esterase
LKLLGLEPERSNAVVSGVVSNINETIQECRRQNTRVVLTPIWPAGGRLGVRRLIWNDAKEGRREANRQLQTLPDDRNNIRVIDLFAQLTNGAPTVAAKEYFRDLLHLNSEAYDRLTPLLQTAIEPWLNHSDNEPR